MNALDILIIVIMGYCLVMGLFRGIIRELTSIVGVIAGFYAAYNYYPHVAKHAVRWMSNTSYINILSFLVIFFTVFILVGILGIIIKYLLKIVTVSWLDRGFGGAFGFFKGILIVSVILMVLTAFLQKGTPVIKNSVLSPYIIFISEKMAEAVPQNMKQEFADKIVHLKKMWKTKT
jgi:membrane protein required for colicin V production